MRHTLLRTLPLYLCLPILLGAYAPLAMAETCTFDRNLDIGIEGEDVRCLQQWLNEHGYVLVESGLGAPGNETSRFGAFTRDALARWQADHEITPARGFFGPRTRVALTERTAEGSPAIPTTPATPAFPSTPTASATDRVHEALALLNEKDRAQAKDLLALLKRTGIVGAVTETVTNTGVTPPRDTFVTLALKAVRMLRDAREAIKDDDASAEDLVRARSNLDDARDDLADAVYAYFNNKHDDALDAIDDAYDNALDALEDAGGSTQADQLTERLEEMEEAVEDAYDTLADREDDGDDVSDAEDLLAEVEDLLDTIHEYLDTEAYADAEDSLDDAEDLVDEALDAVIDADEEEAQDALDEAEEAIGDAENAIDDALDDDEDVVGAEEHLDDAYDFFEEAESAFDSEDYEEASALAAKARKAAQRAMDAL